MKRIASSLHTEKLLTGEQLWVSIHAYTPEASRLNSLGRIGEVVSEEIGRYYDKHFGINIQHRKQK
jgi:hypothetical protein